MTKRRKGREVALQFLYQLDLQGEIDPAPHAAEFWARHPLDEDLREFAEELVRGTRVSRWCPGRSTRVPERPRTPRRPPRTPPSPGAWAASGRPRSARPRRGR